MYRVRVEGFGATREKVDASSPAATSVRIVTLGAGGLGSVVMLVAWGV